MHDRIGQQLGNYRLTRLIARGGFSDVYLGEHVFLERKAAIKLLRNRLTDDALSNFLQEARIISGLNHPNIVQIHDFGEEDGLPYLVMSFAPQGTLRQRHPKGTSLESSYILYYVRQVASALQYAHEQKLVHRDVKPENMLLGENNEILLSDFGIAVVGDDNSFQSLLDIAGTMAYMAPEQFSRKVHPASDQYSLGVIVYEWICGKPPFEGSFSEVAVQHMTEPPPSLIERVPHLPPAVESVVLKALEKEPLDRFAGIHEFAEALERAFNTSPTLSNLPEIVITTSPAIDRDITTAGRDITPESSQVLEGDRLPENTFATRPIDDSFIEELPPLTSLERLPTGLLPQLSMRIPGLRTITGPLVPTRERTVSMTIKGHAAAIESLCWSPDGTQLISGSLDKTVRIWHRKTGRKSSQYKSQIGTIHAVTFSADGRYIAYAGSHGNVQVRDLFSTYETFDYTKHTADVFAVAWASDSQRLASGGADRMVHVYHVADLQPFVYQGHTDWVRALVWSPNGEYIASAGNDKKVHIWNAATGDDLLVYGEHTDWVRALAWSPDGAYIASAGNDKKVHIWNATTGHKLLEYNGHGKLWLGSVLALSWSPRGAYIASAGEDRTVQVWEYLTGKTLFVYKGHSAPVYTVAWSPDGAYIASAGNDKVIHIWSAR
jgi:serine/threonine protein kinase